MNININKKIVGFLIHVYVFILIYMPPISNLLLNMRVEIILGFLLLAVFPFWLYIKSKSRINKKRFKMNLILIVGVLFSSLYFALRASIALNELRLVQNLYILTQLLHVVFLVDIMKWFNYDRDDMLKVLFNLGMLQGIICIVMLIFPITKTVALVLYYLGREENIFISRMRIYGISGDYTFFTPIYHGIIATLACYYAILIDKKHLIYIPFILLATILNGRTGVAVFIIGVFFGFFYFLIKNVSLKKIITYNLLGIFFILVTLGVLKLMIPYSYNWIIGGIKDTQSLIQGKGKTGNYVALAGSMLHFPAGFGLLFGEGHRVYSKYGIEKGYESSDIGYVNDIYMGGIIYVLIQYTVIIWFVLSNTNYNIFHNKKRTCFYKVSSIFFILALLATNFKGETMRSGAILVGIILMKNIFITANDISYQK